MTDLLQSPFVLLFALIAVGMVLGMFNYRGLSLSTAGVFFLALVLGHFQYTVPPALTEFGLVMFVYSVGLQSGSRFFRVLRTHGMSFLVVGFTAAAAGAVVTYVMAQLVEIPAHLAAGLFAGSTTCTPALAAVLDAVQISNPESAAMAAVGYAVGYPFSVIATVLFVQMLPRLWKTTVRASADEYRRSQAAQTEPLERCAFRITNPNCGKMTIDELHALRLTNAVLCRVEHEGRSAPARPGTVLHMGDVVVAVGTPAELAKLETILGTIAPEPVLDPAGAIASELIVVSRKEAFGRRLRDLHIWQRYGVSVTRFRRGVTEFAPHGDTILEPGDVLRLVGLREDVAAVADLIGREERRLDETSMIPFAAGIAVGAALGSVSIPLPGGLHFQLGTGGGAFIVALILGHFGHVGPWRLHVPNAAKQFARELGLVIFLAGAGTVAGRELVSVLRETGLKLVAAGAIVTLVTTITAILVMQRVHRWNVLFSTGGLSAVMTSPPGLSAATEMTDSEAPAIGFASVYPIALLAKIALAPILYLLLSR